MGKSFMLRDEQGKTVGYIQQAGEALRCRIYEAKGRIYCDLYLVDGVGNIHITKINAIHQEHEWRETHMTVTGGCVVLDGKILADTGEEARRRARAYLQQNAAVRESDVKREEIVERSQADKNKPAISLRRRWPPNPCCPENAFENGN